MERSPSHIVRSRRSWSLSPQVPPGIPALAEKIIQAASREHPADGVMRAELKAQHGLSRDDGARVSKAVFAYFRWLGWLDERQSMRERIDHALDLAHRY